MRKRFKTWRWILIQVNANPRASPAMSVWLSAAREINPRKLLLTFSNHMASTPLRAVSFPALPVTPQLSSLPLPGRRGSRLAPSRDFPPSGFSDLILPYNSNFGVLHCGRDLKKILAEHQTPLPLSLLHLLQPLYKNLKSVLVSFNGNR